jgi:hypothetical protein
VFRFAEVMGHRGSNDLVERGMTIWRWRLVTIRDA